MRFLRFNMSQRKKRKLARYWSRVSWYVGYPFYHIRNFFYAIGVMLAEWWRRRIVRYLLQGLPALLATIGIILFGALVYAQDRNLLATDYLRQGALSLQDAAKRMNKGEEAPGQLAMAEMCFQRLLVLQNKDQNRYLLAQVLEVKKQREAMIELLRTLAPPDKTGYPQAHLNMATLYLSQQIPPPPGSNPGRAAENHLRRASLAKQPAWVAPQAHFVLAELYKRWNMPKEAEAELDKAAAAVPEWRGYQAEWFMRNGKPDQAKLYADMAVQVFRPRVEANPDNHSDRMSYAEALVLKGDYSQAVEVLRLGATLTQENERLHAAYAVKTSAAYVAWYRAKAADPQTTAAEKLDLLEKALTWYPANEPVYPLLLQMARQPGPEAEKARRMVVERTLTEPPSWMAHLYLGMEAWSADNVNDARHHWEKAFSISKGAPLVANNLAWVIANYPPGNEDPARGLAMIDAAIKQLATDGLPPAPPFHGTRGHILAKLGRHEEALPELEKSIPAYQNDEKLFRQLAETCDKLNMPKVSADYRRRADEIKEKTKVPTPRVLPGPDAKPLEPPKDVPGSTPGATGPDAPKPTSPPAAPGGKAGTAAPPDKP
jgi:tetratricopeptide (TPR) repeat protein